LRTDFLTGYSAVVDFINEVEEELRKDDYNRLLKRYGPAIAAVIAAIILGAAFLEYREYAEGKVASATAAEYTAAAKLASDGNADASIAAFVDMSERSPNGYAGLALMRAAALELERNNAPAAVGLYDRAAARFDAPRHKQLAQLKAAYILADVASRLGVLAQAEAPYEYLARELLGFVSAQSGDVSAAREQFSYLTTIPGVPPTIKDRAEQSMILMRAGQAMAAPEPVTAPDAPSVEDIATEETSDKTEATQDEN
jgi:hypothetical protein